MDEHPPIHSTVILVEPTLTDFVAGGETGILDVPVLASGDWRQYYPTNATQLMKASNGQSYGDTDACVSFAACQSVETQLNHQIATGAVNAENLQWLHDHGYIDPTGSVLLSKRFTARMSNTDPAVGNSLPAVWGSLHNDGAVPESMWPMPTADFDALVATNSFQGPQDFWAIYYKMPPAAAIALGKEFKARFPILYEWLVYPAAPAAGATLLQDLSVAPLEIATAVCSGWNTDDPIKACGAGTQHATLLGFVEATEYDILDHYVPYQKHFAGDYTITYGMRGVVGQAIAVPPPTFHHTFSINLSYGAPAGSEVQAMQTALQTVKRADGTTYMKAGVIGPYGPQTRTAVDLFQRDHGIQDPNPGEHWGPQTRAAMNTALN